jgi:hypothetical protein
LSGRIKTAGLFESFVGLDQDRGRAWICCLAGSRPRACLNMLSGRIKTAGLFESFVGLDQDRGLRDYVVWPDQDRGPVRLFYQARSRPPACLSLLSG